MVIRLTSNFKSCILPIESFSIPNMENNQLTFNNWLKGEFELSTVYSIIESGCENSIPKIDPRNIQPDEVCKIYKKQEEIFERLIKEYSSLLISDFNVRYTTSPAPQTTLKLQVNDIIATIRGKKRKFSEFDLIIEKTGQLIRKSFATNFQNYVNRKLKGIHYPPVFIPSPNSKLFDQGKYMLPEVYVESLVKLYTHLSKFDNTLDHQSLFKDEYLDLFADDPFNDSPEIFISGHGLKLFHQLDEALIVQPYMPGDYALIHRMLIHKEAKAIKSNVSLEKFFDYVNTIHAIKLNPKSNKSSYYELKKNIIRFFLRRYFYKTRTHDSKEIELLVKKVVEQKTT